MIFGRRRQPAPAVPAPPTHEATVAGHRVEVHTPPAAVDAYLDGRILQQVIAVRPRGRTEPDPRLPAGARMLLEPIDARPHEATTGDAAFDARYVVQGPLGVDPVATLTEPLRALLLEHDFFLVVAYANGAWVGVAHDGPEGERAAEQATLRALELLVRT